MTLLEVKKIISETPTMMGIAREKTIISALMQAEGHFVEDFSQFSEIMNDLLISRSASFYELKESDRPFFETFADWLIHVSQYFDGGKREEIEDYARIYREFP